MAQRTTNLPVANAAGITHTLEDGTVLVTVSDNGTPERFTWAYQTAGIGRDDLDFATGTDETSGRVIGTTGTNQLTTLNQESEETRNQILLLNGFFPGVLTRDASQDQGTRQAYTGSIAGYSVTTYWFDSSDSSWYDAATGGNRLIGFQGVT